VFDEIPHSEKVLKGHQNSDDHCIMAWDHYMHVASFKAWKDRLVVGVQVKALFLRRVLRGATIFP
jgi:hypothetical protein